MSRAVVVLLAAASLVVAGCSTASAPDSAGSAAPHPHADHSKAEGAADPEAEPAKQPLRKGERFARLEMPAAYTPSAPYGRGTDDYRCFLLDPGLREDAFITGIDVLPGTEDVVHHVILFRVPPESVPQAEANDSAQAGQGWTCFGGPGLPGDMSLESAPWLGAWAPGGGEQVMAEDVGVPLEVGSRVVMQVHYNLRAGPEPDVTAARLRLASGDRELAALETMLLPAPVELPCRPGHEQGRLCDRLAAMDDVEERFGDAGQTANFLHLLCRSQIEPGPEQHCDHRVRSRLTVRAAAGHMHLLGRSIRIDVNPGTPRARRVLDVPVWDFDNQGSRPVPPFRLDPGDTVRVTCEHDQGLRDVLPAFDGQPERYVVWGEGTADEMCLGLLMVTRP